MDSPASASKRPPLDLHSAATLPPVVSGPSAARLVEESIAEALLRRARVARSVGHSGTCLTFALRWASTAPCRSRRTDERRPDGGQCPAPVRGTSASRRPAARRSSGLVSAALRSRERIPPQAFTGDPSRARIPSVAQSVVLGCRPGTGAVGVVLPDCRDRCFAPSVQPTARRASGRSEAPARCSPSGRLASSPRAPASASHSTSGRHLAPLAQWAAARWRQHIPTERTTP